MGSGIIVVDQGKWKNAENGGMNLTLSTFKSAGQPFFNITTPIQNTLSDTRISRTFAAGTPVLKRLVWSVDLCRQLGRRDEFSHV